ncbi:hypothetical protein CDV31_005424 [Fusarium ambrosium]|uniref:Apple domain-containing protein n=1 Tax=Fusarium ambrosium TaxID=131363 RepID=A0A428UJD4_9HYPO|nr:hypothetical protein CDV31_005424 [Fusarium ambrosium]
MPEHLFLTTSIIISTSEELTEGLVCGDDGYVQPGPGLKYTNLGAFTVEACTAACIEVADCYFFLINKGSKACTLYRMSKQEAGFQKVATAAYIAYERGCFVC